MPNNPIPIEKQERIVNLSDRGWAIRRIATETGTCRPTVRKYREIGVQNKNTK
jgi:DNA-binding NarL/FixJ family response regulator